ncbi:MAG: nuclear transport factor 2 family protein [Candidatus Woesearchaeota archaeon]|nr:nuclear transport factor 2 family protein [Candidatus Woesearchaeota archaeon]
MSLGTQLVELCKQGKNREAVETLYADDIVSIEAHDDGKMPTKYEGKEAVMGKHDWWENTFEVLEASCDGPFYNEAKDEFMVYFKMKTKNKETGETCDDAEVGHYFEKEGKVVKEMFYYGDGN